jgi:integrase
MASKSTTSKSGRKLPKDFPLWVHGASGRWARKVRGVRRYFGYVQDDPDGAKALEEWLRVRDDLLAGREPRPKVEGVTVADIANRFLTAKKSRLETGEIGQRMFDEYFATCELIVREFGGTRVAIDLTAEDFASLRATIAKNCGLVRIGNEVQRVRSLFKFAYEEGLIDRPVRYGQGFVKPNRKALREARNRRAARMFEADEIRQLLDAAGVHLRAMILLGANCGFGNGDIERLPIEAVDLTAGWIEFPRPKTGIPRRVPLWPETVAAIKASLAKRPTPKSEDDAGLVFITKYGRSWHSEKTTGPIALQFRRLLDSLGLYKPGRGFYSLRHMFETIGGDSQDQVAVDAIMGHVRDDMASVYRERIGDDRLQAVVDHVRNWLFGVADDINREHDRRADQPVHLRVVS